MDKIGEINSMKFCHVLAFGAASFLISCAGTWAGKPPPCPPFTGQAVDDIEEMVTDNDHEALLIWIGDVDRYCDGIKAMRES